MARFHGEEAAQSAHKGAGNLIQEGEVPAGTPEVEIGLDGELELPISAAVNKAGLAVNAAQTRDMVKNGRVKVDWAVVDATFKLVAGRYLIQAGKKKIAWVVIS